MKVSPFTIPIFISILSVNLKAQDQGLRINDQEYFEMPGLNVMMFHDYYAIGHQSGITIIQNGSRVAANGDVRMYPMDRPMPENGHRVVDRANNEVSVQSFYNDTLRQKYNDPRYPYPDINITSTIRVRAVGKDFRIIVDLDEPLPSSWEGRIGFTLELFPGDLFEKPYYMDGKPGTFPRPMNGPAIRVTNDLVDVKPLAAGKKLVIRPESPTDMISIESTNANIELVDGRVMRNNGWYVIRSPLQTGATKGALEWIVKVGVQPEYWYQPIIQVSQVGYRTTQEKVAVIEMDKRETDLKAISLLRVKEGGGFETVKVGQPAIWGEFLRYQYARFDFSDVIKPGVYKLRLGDCESNLFVIDDEVYKRHVWQPTLEYYLPAQMCHVRVNDRVKVWHGLCHDDDALMAPVNHIHFDGYRQGPSTLTKYKPGDQVPGLNVGGWHDAGDYDLRVESQANTVRILAHVWELFKPLEDETTVMQDKKIVEMHQPDGIPDVLQQIEHGVLTVVAGYNNLGRLYRGMICPTGRQYSLLGDGSVMTDNLKFDPALDSSSRTGTTSGIMDDRWVFTEENPRRELDVAACLATAYRCLRGYNDALAQNALNAAGNIWELYRIAEPIGMIDLSTELYKSTGDTKYMDYILKHKKQVVDGIRFTGPAIARLAKEIKDKKFMVEVKTALVNYNQQIVDEVNETPFGVRYKPNIWGDGWSIQRFGVNQYFLHRSFPDIFSAAPVFNSMNFVLGVHPGSNTASFVSGVGANSLLVAYGTNRDEWSYIPGGSASGTALIRPDLPELKIWPYFWQQTEYVMGGGATNYMFLVLACDDMMEKK